MLPHNGFSSECHSAGVIVLVLVWGETVFLCSFRNQTGKPQRGSSHRLRYQLTVVTG